MIAVSIIISQAAIEIKNKDYDCESNPANAASIVWNPGN
jgi:hypothetical protein